MRVLMLSSEFPPSVGGLGSHVYELARALTSQGDSVEVVSLSVKSLPAFTVLDGIKVHRPRLIAGMPFYDWHLSNWLRKFLNKNKFDVVHVHGLRAAVATRGLSIPTLFTNHTSGLEKRSMSGSVSRSKALRRISHFPSMISPSLIRQQAAQTLGYLGKTQVIPNGVDADRFAPNGDNWRKKLALDSEVPVLVFAARLVPVKGLSFLVNSLSLLPSEHFKLLVVGDGPERGHFIQALKQAGLSSRVELLGNVANTDMPAVFRTADIAVLSSSSEGMSVSMLEAMACGLPVVSSAVGGMPELVSDGVTGFLVPFDDCEKMANRIQQLLNDKVLRQQMGKAGRLKIEQSFTWQEIASRTRLVYGQLVGCGS